MIRRPVPPRRQTHLPPPLYEGAARLHDWRHTARSGMTADLGITDSGPSDLHPFKGLSCGKEHGQRLRVWIGPPDTTFSAHAAANAGEGPQPHYTGEAVLIRWSDDSVWGMSVRIEIDSGPDGTAGKHPLEGYATGKREGEPFYFAVWAVADDETLQAPSRVRRRLPFEELTETKQANILCRDRRFISFLARLETTLVTSPCEVRPEQDPSDFAARTLRSHLGIESRAQLSHGNMDGERARARWKGLLAAYYRSPEWLNRHRA